MNTQLDNHELITEFCNSIGVTPQSGLTWMKSYILRTQAFEDFAQNKLVTNYIKEIQDNSKN